jgi:hypothetical protein
VQTPVTPMQPIQYQLQYPVHSSHFPFYKRTTIMPSVARYAFASRAHPPHQFETQTPGSAKRHPIQVATTRSKRRSGYAIEIADRCMQNVKCVVQRKKDPIRCDENQHRNMIHDILSRYSILPPPTSLKVPLIALVRVTDPLENSRGSLERRLSVEM